MNSRWNRNCQQLLDGFTALAVCHSRHCHPRSRSPRLRSQRLRFKEKCPPPQQTAQNLSQTSPVVCATSLTAQRRANQAAFEQGPMRKYRALPPTVERRQRMFIMKTMERGVVSRSQRRLVRSEGRVTPYLALPGIGNGRAATRDYNRGGQIMGQIFKKSRCAWRDHHRRGCSSLLNQQCGQSCENPQGRRCPKLGEPNESSKRYQGCEAFGETGAGLIAKIPFFEQIVWSTKRIRRRPRWSSSQVLSTDTAFRLQVDALCPVSGSPIRCAMYIGRRQRRNGFRRKLRQFGLGSEKRLGKSGPFCRLA